MSRLETVDLECPVAVFSSGRVGRRGVDQPAQSVLGRGPGSTAEIAESRTFVRVCGIFPMKAAVRDALDSPPLRRELNSEWPA